MPIQLRDAGNRPERVAGSGLGASRSGEGDAETGDVADGTHIRAVQIESARPGTLNGMMIFRNCYPAAGLQLLSVFLTYFAPRPALFQTTS